ncbi:hypothetical protein GCM10028791_29690 [Echinicola sediminis]
MKSFKNIALCADLTEMDDLLFNYIKQLDKSFDFENLTVVHLIEIEEIPEELNHLIPDLGKSIEEVIESELREMAGRYFGEENQNIKFHVQPGGDVEAFSDYFDKEQFELIILGKKNSYLGSGILSAKLARLTNCNILFVPETAQASINTITLAIDFSHYTDKIIPIAKRLAQATESKLSPIHVLKIGIQYFPYIKNYHKLSEELEANALHRFKKLQQKYGLKEAITLIKDNAHNISKLIYNHALRDSSHLIIVGNKGKKDKGDLLIGSVTEQLIAHDKNLPVLIVKK